MLAQLQLRADVETARVDRRGELLRIRVRTGGSIEAVRDALKTMGFAAETAIGIGWDTVRWFGPTEVRELSEIFRGKIVDVGADELVIELSGEEQKIEAFIEHMRRFGITELVRTGRIDIVRSNAKRSGDENGETPSAKQHVSQLGTALDSVNPRDTL